jgi:hypothetical protein
MALAVTNESGSDGSGRRLLDLHTMSCHLGRRDDHHHGRLVFCFSNRKWWMAIA